MDYDDVREIALALPATSESFPFGPQTPVFKTTANNKVFAITSEPGAPDPSVTLKAIPDDAEVLRADHPEITPGYHMNKKHWITVRLDGALPPDLVEDMITQSYRLVRPRPPRAPRAPQAPKARRAPKSSS